MPDPSLFFAWHLNAGMLLYGSHDPWLVALSIAVAMFSSTMGLQAAFQARGMPTRGMRHLTLLAGSLSLGGGVWAMHFVGMLAFRLCTTVQYDPRITLLSMLPSLAASRVALDIISRDEMTTRRLWLGGLLVGSGIGAMHYLGMAAMRMSAALRYDPLMFAVSIVVAVSLAMLALYVRFGVARSGLGRMSSTAQSMFGGAVMGLAIAGMHYTGMAAARFVGTPQSLAPIGLPDAGTIALAITLVSMTATALVAGATGLARYRQLIERLQTKGARLRAISHSSIDGIVVFDGQGIVQDFNPGAQRIHGMRAEDVIGRHLGMLMPVADGLLAQADFRAFLANVIKPDLNRERETFALHRDGREVPIRLVIAAMDVPGAELYVAFLSDITERVRMSHELRESEGQLRSLIANIPGVAYRCRMEPRWPMSFISDAVEGVTGWPAADFLGESPRIHVLDLMPPQDAARVTRLVEEAVQDKRHFVLEFQLNHRDGGMRWIWASGSIVRDGEEDEVLWVDGVLLDITQRHQMEEALREAKEKAEAAAQARTTFLANMSHEIRTPMNAILGFTDVVLSGELPGSQRKHLETVHKAARNLLHLLNDILDTSKLEQNAVVLEQLDFSLPDLVQQLCAEQSIHARRKQLALDCEIDANVGEHVKGDPHRLRQILLNLLGNAIKFTEIGCVHLRVQRKADGVHFSVRDTGIGIAPDRLPRIFDAFTQADASMSRRFGGTGLGTTIAKQLTELMHGHIWAESTPGEGSTFHVMLPMAQGDAAAAARLDQARRGLRLAPLRILAADDVPQNLELLTLLLGRHGHAVVTAADGQHALDATERETFDVILMDVQMPVMDGLAACRALRGRERATGRARTPVLALSASVLHEDRQAAIDAGMDGFAGKPVDMIELMREVARVTGRAPLPDAAAPSSNAADATGAGEADATLIDTGKAMPLWQDWPRYLQALQRFAADHAAWRASQRALAPAPADAFQEAHRLKGAAANLGLARIGAAAAETEALARDPASSDLPAAWRALHGAFQATLDEIARLARSTPAPARVPPGPDADMPLPVLRRQLTRLREAFQRGECLDALLAEVRPALRPWVVEADLAHLADLVDMFDFDGAAAALARMAEALPAGRTPEDACAPASSTDPERADAAL